ncbi:MAG: TorF family putative porin [Methylophilus sp.]|nr:TorF family putative porin [Methylophilus sp.]
MYQPSIKLLSAAILMGCLSAPVMADEVAPAPAAAEAEAKPDWSFVGNVTLVSDYIFRGQSQSWGKPSLQAFVEADHKSGFYAGFSAASVSGHWLPGADLEADYFAGFRNSLPGAASAISFDVGVIYYTYPEANWSDSAFAGTNPNSLDTAEAYLALTYKWFTFKTGTTLTEYFGWNPNNSGVGSGFAGDLNAGVTGDTKYSSFYELNGLYEVMPSWTLGGQIGRQTISHSTGLDITYYKIGVTKAFASGWSVGANYSATNEPSAYKGFLSLENTTSASDIAEDKFFVTVSKGF